MDYKAILNEIKPNEAEKNEILGISNEIISKINQIASEEEIICEAKLVGSVAKETFLKGNGDIDIFISFSLNTSIADLKEKGLFLAHKTAIELNADVVEKYASHPYLTIYINGQEVDLVPCYDIENSDQIKSAVDRTILHTEYIKKHLNDNQKDEVILLKKFMKEIGVYGSEFKVGGFAGYLCEMLILKYETFKNTLIQSSKWRYNEVIDLEDYKTFKLFKDPLIAIDPTDKNRNVGAALSLEKMNDFVFASRNYLASDDDKRLSFFYPLNRKNISKDFILNSFNNRESKTILILFSLPKMAMDNVYPQISKTTQSLKNKLEDIGFKIIYTSFWSDEKAIGLILIEFDSWRLSKYDENIGPKIYYKTACEEFTEAHGGNVFLKNQFLVQKKERKFRTPEDLINFIFKNEENIKILKIGKDLKNSILNEYKLFSINEFLDNLDENNPENDESFLFFLDDYLNPSQHLKR
jgi:tRNA nucleotidyltransferase (CCA-adding enzyme)